MAFSNSTSDRLDELRFRSQQTTRNENSLLGLVSPPRTSRLPPPTSENRGFITRRFTTDSSRVPTLSSLASSRVDENREYTMPSTYHKVQLLEKKKLEYERLREQKRRFEAEMQILDLQQRQEEQELRMMQEDLGRHSSSMGVGHQSEPTTPPEYRESSSGFPSMFSRPNRYSTSSISSPIGQLYNRPGRSASTITSSQFGLLPSRFTMEENVIVSNGAGSRRGSAEDDDKEQAVRQDPSSHRSSSHHNRYSMPVTKSRNGVQDMLALDQTNTARFLFGDDENSAEAKSFLQMQSTKDNFPILLRGEQPQKTNVSSAAALDLASDQSTKSEHIGWSPFARHRPGQQSLPANTITSSLLTNGVASTMSGAMPSSAAEAPVKSHTANRFSQDLNGFQQTNAQKDAVTSPVGVPATPPKLQSSYSANDVPTMKSNGLSSGNTMAPAPSHQQHLHNHNVSLGRIPVGAVNNRQAREVAGDSTPVSRETQSNGYSSTPSALTASVPPFAPSNVQTSMPQMPQGASATFNPYAAMSPQQQYPYGYNMNMMNMTMNNMNIGTGQQQGPYDAYGGYGMMPYQTAPNHTTLRDSQARVIAQRRQNDGEVMNRFANTTLESLGGEIYTLCKDQHGCRFLQKKLEERNPDHIHMIWQETNQHVIELMTDPFGNYLCQKLLEFCNDEERTILIQNAAPELVRIALNQHGTRALQKMIEFISTPQQVQIIIDALRHQVVDLIQDLNGNHVIQKCLNKLSSEDAQFIFDAVGNSCVDVGTHRHGCCVLQRCIDHASGEQKAWLIRMISNNAFTLVQDPFGNYVVQYILDLDDPSFTEPLVGKFKGKVSQLSKQKFSSNVIEKCLRCAQDTGRDMLIEELLAPAELERLLRDSYANYVIQTAIDYANGPMKTRLIDAIRPVLPQIRSTPYGRRIQAKIQGIDNRPPGGEIINPGGTNGKGHTYSIREVHARSLSNASQGGFNPSSMPFNPAYGNGVNGRPPATFPSSQTILEQGINAFPDLARKYEEIAHKRATGEHVYGVDYF